MAQKIDGLHESYLIYTDSPETKKTGDCQQVDGRGWVDTRQSSLESAKVYIANAEGIPGTVKYHPCG